MFRRTSGVMETVPTDEDRRDTVRARSAEDRMSDDRMSDVRTGGRVDGTGDRPLPPPAYAVPSAYAGGAPTPVPAPAPLVTGTAERESSVVVSHQRLSVAGFLAGLAGIALVAMGLIAVLRGGLSGPIDEPVVEVMGFAHTPLLGLADIGMGVLLLLAAVTARRGALALLGSLGVVAGAVAIAETAEVQRWLAAEPSYGWVWIAAGAVIALAAWMLPVYDREVRTVRDEVHAV